MGGDEGFLRGDLRRKILNMDLPDAIEFCLSLPAAEETVPFGPDVLVYKVAGKMFALTQPDEFPSKMNLKCDPARAISLREDYDAITPGYHMNKQHWNTVDVTGGVPEKLIRELVDHSYELVRASLPRKVREEMD